MKRLTCALLIGALHIVAPLTAMAADARAPFEVMPPGGVSCASWIQGRDQAGRDDVVLLNQQGLERAEREGWVSGYLTALNIEILPRDRGVARNLTEGIDRGVLMAQIDEYCVQNPLHSLLDATATVVPELANRWLAAHPPLGRLSDEGVRLPSSGLATSTVPVSPNEEPPTAAATVPLSEVRSAPLPPPSEQAPPPPPALPPPVAQAPMPAPDLRGAVDAASGGALLQIGAYRTNALAQQAWDEFRVDHREIVRDLASDVQAVNLGERGIWHRLRIGPYSDRAAAEGACAILLARGAECFAVTP